MVATNGQAKYSSAPSGAPAVDPIILALIFAVLTIIGAAFKGEADRAPYADERYYINEGVAIVDQGFDRLVDRRDAVDAFANVMPVYPAFLGGVLALSDRGLQSARCVLAQKSQGEESCDLDFSALFWVQYLLAALSVGLIVWFVSRVFRSAAAGALAGVFVLASGMPLLYANRYLTEAVYFTIVAGFSVSFYFAVYGRVFRRFVLCGALLGLAALTRASFLYAVMPVIAVIVFIGPAGLPWRLRALRCAVFVATFLVVLGPWFWSNYKIYKSLTPGSTNLVLVSRLANNLMTPVEYAAAWVYWLPDFGDKLAERLFGGDAVERLKFEGKDSFYRAGKSKVMADARRELLKTPNAVEVEAQWSNHLQRWMIEEKIIGDLPKHLAVSVLLSWRGVFVGKYAGMIGLAALIALLLSAWGRPYRRAVIVIGAVPVFTLGLQAFTSLNIPRYNIVMLIPMAAAVGLMLDAAGRAFWRKAGFNRHGP